jgi:hypothetical protein
MALTPDTSIEITEVMVEDLEIAPSKTYKINFDTGEIENVYIDGTEALRQYVVKSLQTPRFRYLIYDWEYGSDIDNLIGDQLPLEILQEEFSRLITETIIYDDRIDDVYNFEFTQTGDSLYVSFDVILDNGDTISEGVTLYAY